ncbi:hypothetical protein WKU26_07050 [Phocaeicola sp. HCN-40430]|uniref:hypothetical protein n=1 Tax=Phocaeicola sp. HCN-40430 TaxID=3134664 RepID=UPI0030C4D824
MLFVVDSKLIVSILPSFTYLESLGGSVYVYSMALPMQLLLVQPTDVLNRLCGQLPVFFQGIHVLPSDMCPTADHRNS